MQERIDKFNDFIKVDSGRVKYFRYLTLADISTGAALVVLSWYIFAKAGVYGFIGAVFFNLGAADLFKIYIWRKAPYSKWVTWCSVALCALQALVALIILIYPFWYKSKILSAFEASITQAKQEFGSDVTVLQQYYTEGNFMIWIILLFSFLYLFFSALCAYTLYLYAKSIENFNEEELLKKLKDDEKVKKSLNHFKKTDAGKAGAGVTELKAVAGKKKAAGKKGKDDYN